MKQGTNLIRNQLERVGLRGWMEEDQEVGSFAYGAQIGVAKENILQHPKEVYRKVADDLHEHAVNSYVLTSFSMLGRQKRI